MSYLEYTCYIIHLKKNEDRLPHLVSQLENVNITNYKIIDGVIPDNKHLYGRASAYGCAISHYNAIKQSYEDGKDKYLIMEDDIVFLDDWKQYVNEYLAETSHLYDNSIFFRKSHKVSSDAIIHDYYIQNDKRQKKVFAECYTLGKTLREHIVMNPDIFLNGQPVDWWFRLNTVMVNPKINFVKQNKDFISNIRPHIKIGY